MRYDGTVGTRLSALLVVESVLAAAAVGKVGFRAAARMAARDCFTPNSFTPTTKVAAATGAATIASLAIGDEVYAYNETTGEVGLYEITATHEHDDPVTINLTVDPNLNDNELGELIETTPEHPFYVLGEWVDAGKLEIGMPISTFEGTELVHSGTVTSVKRIEAVQTMYNLTIDTAHTFFVGEGRWLVHSIDCPINYRIDATGMKCHTNGQFIDANGAPKSQFLFDVDAEQAVIDAAKYADDNNLWINGKAKVFVENGPVGVISDSRETTNWINVYRRQLKDGTYKIHGAPGTAPK